MDFRPITHHDLSEVKMLQDLLFPVKYSDAFYESLVSGADGMHCLLAVDAETAKIAGIVSMRVQGREGYIATIGVDPSFRRQGIARSLLRKAAVVLQNYHVHSLILHVKVDNQAAIELYKSEGFNVKRHLVNHYYINDEYYDALELERIEMEDPGWCALI